MALRESAQFIIRARIPQKIREAFGEANHPAALVFLKINEAGRTENAV